MFSTSKVNINLRKSIKIIFFLSLWDRLTVISFVLQLLGSAFYLSKHSLPLLKFYGMNSNTNSIGAKKAIFEQNLNEGSDEFIISTLEELRENGEDYMVDAIVNLLFTARSEVLKEAVVNFLVDIKNQTAVANIIGAIEAKRNSADVARLVSVCWQSRLDFSNEVDLFIDLLCHSNYQISIEAFSVIENSLESINGEKVLEYIAYLKREVGKTHQSTQALVQQMIQVMEEYQSED